MRLIDADALEKVIEEKFQTHYGNTVYQFIHDFFRCCIRQLRKAPTIDPASLRPKGAWIDNHCSACGMMPMGEEMWDSCDFAPPKFEWFMNFCPNCGADMRTGANACVTDK